MARICDDIAEKSRNKIKLKCYWCGNSLFCMLRSFSWTYNSCFSRFAVCISTFYMSGGGGMPQISDEKAKESKYSTQNLVLSVLFRGLRVELSLCATF